jgi:hypothetical protein
MESKEGQNRQRLDQAAAYGRRSGYLQREIDRSSKQRRLVRTLNELAHPRDK